MYKVGVLNGGVFYFELRVVTVLVLGGGRLLYLYEVVSCLLFPGLTVILCLLYYSFQFCLVLLSKESDWILFLSVVGVIYCILRLF
jgi:hypothetical protein